MTEKPKLKFIGVDICKKCFQETDDISPTTGICWGCYCFEQGKLAVLEKLSKEFHFMSYDGMVLNEALRKWLKSQIKEKEAKK